MKPVKVAQRPYSHWRSAWLRCAASQTVGETTLVEEARRDREELASLFLGAVQQPQFEADARIDGDAARFAGAVRHAPQLCSPAVCRWLNAGSRTANVARRVAVGYVEVGGRVGAGFGREVREQRKLAVRLLSDGAEPGAG